MPVQGQQCSLDCERYASLLTEVSNERDRQVAEVNRHFPEWRGEVQGILAGERSSPEIEGQVQQAVCQAIDNSRKRHGALLSGVEERYRESLRILRAHRLGGIMDEVQKSGDRTAIFTVDEMNDLLVPALGKHPRSKVGLHDLVHPGSHVFIDVADAEREPGTRRLRWQELSQRLVPVVTSWEERSDALVIRLQPNEERAIVPLADPKAGLPIFNEMLSMRVQELVIGALYSERASFKQLLRQQDHALVDDRRLFKEEAQRHVAMRLPGTEVGEKHEWQPLTELSAYFVRPELIEKLPAHAVVA